MMPIIEHQPTLLGNFTAPKTVPVAATAKKLPPWRKMNASEPRQAADQYKAKDGTWKSCADKKDRGKWAKAEGRTRRPLPASAKSKSKKR